MTSPAVILLVDSTERSLKVAASLLSQDGHRVLTVSNLDDAENIIENQPLDLILIELNLPEISGHDYADYLRDARHVNAPIVLWSSINPDRLGTLVAECGAAGAIRKDIEMNNLAADVRKFLPMPRVNDTVKAPQ